uniref:L1 transposable element RRM domain-containing protein n=1 Tax=Sus scrofa TaxID=9823 RepID=A0A8D1CLY6_PIG
MKKLRNHPQLNQQENLPKAVNEDTDLCSLTDLEFKREIVKILKELREDMSSNADSLRKDLENIRRSQEKLENSFAEIQTELRAVKTRRNNAEERISDVEDRIMEITQSGQQTENQMKKHESNIKRANLRIIRIPEGVEKDKGMEKIFEEIIAGNFPNLKDTEFKIQEAQRAPNKLNPNRPTPRHTIIKMAKVSDKERILKAAREKQNVTYKGIAVRLSADFSAETLQAKREWQEIFKVLKGKNMQPRILYPARISFKIEGEIKFFSNKQKLKEYSNTKPRLKEILKGLL